jgi:FAD/FMN-containing dehydrogenase
MQSLQSVAPTPTEASWSRQLPALRAALRGAVLLPSDPTFDSSRRVFNAMVDRHPALIVQCRDVADVVAAVRFGRKQNLAVSVRGGGHGVAGTAIVDDGLVIDLSVMRSVWVDPKLREAWVQGGALWGDVDHATQLHGLAVPGGLISNTGVGGFTLGGGVGWSSRMYGLACDNVTEFEMVTAAGDVIRATSQERPDLLWALRGAGGNFGVVTGFRFALHPIGPTVYGGMRLFPGGQARDLLRLVRDLQPRSPPELNVAAVLTTAPASPMIPPPWQGKQVAAMAMAYFGPLDHAEDATRELREFPNPIVEHVSAMPYTVMQTFLDPLAPPGLQNYWKSLYASSLPDVAIDAVVERFRDVPSPLTEVHLHYFGGGAVAAAEAGSAVGSRQSPFLFNFMGRWTEAGEKDRNIAFVRGLWDTVRPYSTGGVYVNFLADQSVDLLRAAYGESNYRRLVAVKQKYDPENFFRANHNIAP